MAHQFQHSLYLSKLATSCLATLIARVPWSSVRANLLPGVRLKPRSLCAVRACQRLELPGHTRQLRLLTSHFFVLTGAPVVGKDADTIIQASAVIAKQQEREKKVLN